jgi:hypothetical protein
MRTATATVLALAMLSDAGWALQNGPLPDTERFLQEARDRLTRSQQVWHQYVYKERRTDVQMNPFGRMGVTGTRVLEIYRPANPALGYRHVIERNGVPVPRRELEQMWTDYRARVQAELQGRGEDGEARQKREQEDLAARRRAQLVVADVLNTLQFDVVRREHRRGASMIVVAFAAKPGAKPSTRQGRIAKVFKGNAWIDEGSREVVWVEAVAVDDVSFGGFIAKLYEGTLATLERREIEPGVWMPINVKLTGDIRALFRKARIDYVVEWFDYKRVDDPLSSLDARVEH